MNKLHGRIYHIYFIQHSWTEKIIEITNMQVVLMKFTFDSEELFVIHDAEIS